MRKSIYKVSLAALALLAGCAEVQQEQAQDANVAPASDAAVKAAPVREHANVPAVGELFNDQVVVGRFTVPLPKGEWLVTSSAVTPTSNVEEASVTLSQFRAGKEPTLSNAVTISTNLQAHRTNYSATDGGVYVGGSYQAKNPAQVGPAFLVEKFNLNVASMKVKPRGFSAVPSVMAVMPTKMRANVYGVEFVKENKVKVDTNDIFTQIKFELVGATQRLFVNYYIDPVAEHIAPSEESIEESKWAPENAYMMSAKEKKFIEAAKSYAYSLKNRLVFSFDHVKGSF